MVSRHMEKEHNFFLCSSQFGILFWTGTACAIPRTMIALIEQGLQPDGRVRLPETLRPFMMGQTMLPFTGDLQLP